MTPRVSVVMSVYNGEPHVRSAVVSILNQTYQDFEFLVVNDGSTDGTQSVLDELASTDRRIRIVYQENQGLTMALRTGCAAAVGELVIRQDADDWSAPTRLEKLVAAIDAHPGAVMASSWAEYVDSQGTLIETITRCEDPAEATRQLLDERCGPPAHGTVLMRLSAYQAVGGYRSEFYYGQDADLWLRLAQIGTIVYVPEVLYRWHVNPRGISGQSADWQHQFGELGRQCHDVRSSGGDESPLLAKAERLRQEVLAAREHKQNTRRQQAATHYRIGTSLIRRGSPEARRHFWAAIQLHPLHWQSWCRLLGSMVLPRQAPASNKTD